MIFGFLIAGTVAGTAAALVALLAFAVPVWLGLIVWWIVGTLVTVIPPVLLAYRPAAEGRPRGFAIA